MACHANQVALANVSTNVLQSCVEEVQKIRNVMRFAIGGISDYEKCEEDRKNAHVIDQYMLHVLYKFHEQVCLHIFFKKTYACSKPHARNQISYWYEIFYVIVC